MLCLTCPSYMYHTYDKQVSGGIFMVHVLLLTMLNVCTFTLVLSKICVQCLIWLFSVFS